jgi:TonB family protein
MTNLFAFAVQVAIVIGAGAALAAAFRLRTPRATLAYWQAILAFCLLLPLVQPWHETVAPPIHVSTDGAVAIETVAAASAVTAAPPRAPRWSAATLMWLILAGGALLRAGWLVVGAVRLQRLRRDAVRLVPPPDPFLTAEDRIGVHADVHVSDHVAGAVTFGLLRPVIVLTPAVLTMPSHVQEAIAYHELLHVRRRDWLYEIFEEAVRTVFWFHPGIWWLIGRIQLSREQVVDGDTIHLTQSRERYVDALLVVALTKSPLALVPAPPFLRRALLKKRVAQILQETTMTTRRLIASLSASAAALMLAATAAVHSFPLEAQVQPTSDTGAPVQIVKGGEHLLHASLPEYPRRAIEQRVEGDVQLDLVLDDRGEVSDARVMTGPDELRRAALESVLQWHYARAALGASSVQTTLRFHLPAAEPEKRAKFGVAFTTEDGHKREFLFNNAELAEHRMTELRRALEDPTASPEQRDEWKKLLAENELLLKKIRADREQEVGRRSEGPLKLVQIRTERVTPETANEVMSRAGVKIGDTISETTAKQIGEIAKSVDEHLRVAFRDDGKGGMVLTLLNP